MASLLIYLCILLTSFQHVLSKEKSMKIQENDDGAELTDDGKRYNKPSYCCARQVATPRWTEDCPQISTKKSCERKTKECKWDLCTKVGYCQWAGEASGSTGEIEKLCSRQTNKANCINKITAGSGKCEWIYGYPPLMTPSPTEYIPPQEMELVQLNNEDGVTFNDNNDPSFYGIEFIAGLLFLVSISFILYKQCCMNEYKSADMALMEMTEINERKGLLSQSV